MIFDETQLRIGMQCNAMQVNGVAFAADKTYRIISTKGILNAPYSEILRNTTVTLLRESEVRWLCTLCSS